MPIFREEYFPLSFTWNLPLYHFSRPYFLSHKLLGHLSCMSHALGLGSTSGPGRFHERQAYAYLTRCNLHSAVERLQSTDHAPGTTVRKFPPLQSGRKTPSKTVPHSRENSNLPA